jgi:hypothetical protein
MSDEKKPRVFYAVWENEEEGDDGYKSGAISTEGGGNLYWCDNQFRVIEYSAYLDLQATNTLLHVDLQGLREENARLKVYEKTIYDYVQCTGNTSPKTLGFHVAQALVMDHAALKVKVERLINERPAGIANGWRLERDRALAIAKKLAGALEYELDGACEHEDTRPGNGREWCHTCSAWIYPSDRKARAESHEALEQFRREFGEEKS